MMNRSTRSACGIILCAGAAVFTADARNADAERTLLKEISNKAARLESESALVPGGARVRARVQQLQGALQSYLQFCEERLQAVRNDKEADRALETLHYERLSQESSALSWHIHNAVQGLKTALRRDDASVDDRRDTILKIKAMRAVEQASLDLLKVAAMSRRHRPEVPAISAVMLDEAARWGAAGNALPAR